MKNIFAIVGFIVILFWLAGFLFHVAGGLIHILLVVGLILIVIHFVTGSRGSGV